MFARFNVYDKSSRIHLLYIHVLVKTQLYVVLVYVNGVLDLIICKVNFS